MIHKITIIFSFMLFIAGGNTFAQSARIELGSDQIAENEVFTITITVEDVRISSYNGFPEIEGFSKRGTTSSTRTMEVNGSFSRTFSITMSYSPNQQGVFILKPFNMQVNGETLKSEGTSITVKEPIQRRSRRNLFDHSPFNDQPSEQEFVEVEDNAFLAVTTSKSEVYVGEGFTMDLSFFVPKTNRAIMDFYDLGKQLSGILKDLRPDNCWEENFNIENIKDETVQINGQYYDQYKIYEAAFYPFNEEPVVFPSVGLEMIKYKVARNPSFFGSNRKEDFKTFNSAEKIVQVKPLPPHPLKDVVTVGDYRLNETLSEKSIETGESFKYDFRIYGEGNITAIKAPEPINNKNFDIYDPEESQKINRRNRKVTGSKNYSYFAIPNEPGTYNLEDYFRWVFFNPKSETYDTLESAYRLTVTGESLVNESIQAADLGSFYDRMSSESNILRSSSSSNWVKIFANIFILSALLIAGFIVFKK